MPPMQLPLLPPVFLSCLLTTTPFLDNLPCHLLQFKIVLRRLLKQTYPSINIYRQVSYLKKIRSHTCIRTETIKLFLNQTITSVILYFYLHISAIYMTGPIFPSVHVVVFPPPPPPPPPTNIFFKLMCMFSVCIIILLFSACPKPGSGFPSAYVVVIFFSMNILGKTQ